MPIFWEMEVAFGLESRIGKGQEADVVFDMKNLHL